jgi:membrane protease YdiL (CAAX protease family)
MTDTKRGLKFLFVGPNGIRAGWRLIIFTAILIGLVIALDHVATWTLARLGIEIPDGLTAPSFLLSDSVALVAVLLAMLMMKTIEHRSLAEYGVPVRNPFCGFFWRGVLWGFLAPSAVILFIRIGHGYSVAGLAIHGAALWRYAVYWAVTNLVLGFAEEFVFRSYPQFTLATGIGFWSAAFLISFGFGALHYFTKPYERWPDFACTSLLALFLCLTLRRTGSLAFAAGFHAAFDYANLFVFSGPNGGQFAEGRLLSASFPGPQWLTGGQLGPEASLTIFPVIAALFFTFNRLYRQAKFPLSPSH